MMRFLGIRREPLMSPNRESDDAKILQAVADELQRHGAEIKVVDAEAGVDCLFNEGPWDLVAPMAEAPEKLERMGTHPRQDILVNPPASVFACYRIRMVPALQKTPLADFPKSEIVPIGKADKLPAFINGLGAWAKRGDVHNTCDHDVVRVMDQKDLASVRAEFASRGIKDIVLQEHLDGDLIKFYGVGPGKWFTWFYHDPAKARKLAFDPLKMDEATAAAAAAMGLEVYGGDAIVTPDGRIRIIDINSWPSFARVRNEASVQIARHLMERTLRNMKKSQRPSGTAAEVL